MRFQGKRVLITGGARGIGLTTARMLLAEGARVGIVAKTEENLERAAAEARDRGQALETFRADVARPEQARGAVEAFVQGSGGIDVLVNNAGMTIPKPFLERTAEDWIRTLEVNLVGAFLCAQAAAKPMLAQGSGKIVNISSIRGIPHCGREGVMDYSAAKSGLISLTKTLAKELAPRITVNSVAPGHTVTDLTAGLPDAVKQKMIEGTPLGRMAQPEDIAKAILFLASEDADFITGQVLLVDGGFSLKAG